MSNVPSRGDRSRPAPRAAAAGAATDPGGGATAVRPGPAVGVDLAASERRDTGFCRLDRSKRASVRVLHTDLEILDAVGEAQPEVVSIDAPLFLPRGRPSIESRGPPHLRACDRWLLRMGIRFFPITLGPMRRLTGRGMALASELRARGVPCIEGYPGAAQDILGIPRMGESLAGLRRGLRALGIVGDLARSDLTHDELDAVTCAWIGRCYLTGDYLAVGDPAEGWMILPSRRDAQSRLTAGFRRRGPR
jgi:hypothetical protein